ncbi:hypothetical protein AMATHDRAFT_48636 [Amanita thiersii Skay4041]|uniref:Uncharacterized protein n=1 Tax=Amanita thiersii Skay4041 TaxID=703135 RepID=A0A2A9NPC6_9AGAR|nr:hypothetical protein AMATHDRAFT_48636 [Amanita thiersii Skay4041]
MQIKPAFVVLALTAAPALAYPAAIKPASDGAPEARDLASVNPTDLEARKFNFGKILRGAAKVGKIGAALLLRDELKARGIVDEEELELATREFEEAFEAHGILEARDQKNHHKKHHKKGGHRKQKHPVAATSATANEATADEPTTTGQQTTNQPRDFDAMEELEAREVGHHGGQRRKGLRKGHGHQFGHHTAVSESATDGSHDQAMNNGPRDFDDFEEFEARDLEVRGDHMKKHKGKGRRKGKHMKGSKHANNANVVANSGVAEEKAAHDADNTGSLETRAFEEQHEQHRHSNRKGRKAGFTGPHTHGHGRKFDLVSYKDASTDYQLQGHATEDEANNHQPRDFEEVDELEARDFEEFDEIEARDFEEFDELEARELDTRAAKKKAKANHSHGHPTLKKIAGESFDIWLVILVDDSYARTLSFSGVAGSLAGEFAHSALHHFGFRDVNAAAESLDALD